MRWIAFIFLLLFAAPVVGQKNADGTLVDPCPYTVTTYAQLDCVNGHDFEFDVHCNCDVDGYELKIYNRWGAELFKTNDLDEIWYCGDYPQGTYIWLISTGEPGSESYKKRHGTFHIIK